MTQTPFPKKHQLMLHPLANQVNRALESIPQTDDTPEVTRRLQKANAQAARYRVERNTARTEAQALQSEMAALRTALTNQYQAEIETLTERLTTAEQTAHQASLHQWRTTALAEQGLPLELAGRLQGESAESIAEDAVRLAKLFPLRKNVRTGHASPDPAPTRAEQIFARIEGRADDVFSLLLHSNLGGGAFEVTRD